jgi:hypothetical protein
MPSDKGSSRLAVLRQPLGKRADSGTGWIYDVIALRIDAATLCEWCPPATLECYRRSHEIALAELDTAMAQDVVGGSGVKIEIWQTEI